MDIFGLYVVVHNSPVFPNIIFNCVTVSFILKHFVLRTIIAQMGSSTSREPEKLLEMIAKLLNKLSRNHPIRCILYDFMREFQVRNFKLQTFFLTINWNIILGVIFKKSFQSNGKFIKTLNSFYRQSQLL